MATAALCAVPSPAGARMERKRIPEDERATARTRATDFAQKKHSQRRPARTRGKSAQAPPAEAAKKPAATPADTTAKRGRHATPEPDLWQRVRDNFGMDLDTICDASEVDLLLRRYEQRTGIYLERILARAEPYLYHVAKQLQQRGMPLELSVLPVVESAYDPFAYSPGHAAGLWQFIPYTAELYGLRRNWWLDERYDVRAATDAALRYISKLHRQADGDWLLAMASYNAGSGSVRRAVARAQKAHTTQWQRAQAKAGASQRALVLATALANAKAQHSAQEHSRLQALRERVARAAPPDSAKESAPSGAKESAPSGEMVTATAELKRAQVAAERARDAAARAVAAHSQAQADSQRLAATAQKARTRAERRPNFWDLQGLPAETRAYIPKFCAIAKIVAAPKRHGITIAPVPDRPYFAVVDTGAQLDLALAAELSGVDTETIYRLNPALQRWATPPNGPHQLLVPVARRAALELKLARLPPQQRLQWVKHHLRAGEGLASIARQYQTTVAALQRINGLSLDTVLRPSDTLLVMAPLHQPERYVLSASQRAAQAADNAVQPPSQHRVYHAVRGGESLWSISRQYGIGSYQQIATWNDLSAGETLPVGTRLALWLPTNLTQIEALATAASSHYERVTYRVRSGDSLTSIARRFGVDLRQIAKWNSLDVHQHIKAQQILVLYPATR